MKKITIAYFVVGLDGGVGNFILNYTDHMPKDYRYIIVTQDDSSDLYKKRYLARNFTIYKIPSKRVSVIKNIKESIAIIKHEQVDIVHANMTATNLFPLFAAWLCGVKTRISHSHLTLDSNISLNLLKRIGNVFATDRLACGVKAGKSLFGNSDFLIINNGIDLDEYKFNIINREKIREKLNIGKDYVVLGNVGRFTEQKNHRFLIGLFNNYHEVNNNSVLLLIGEGELEPEIREEIKSKKLEGFVRFTGAINNVNEYYSAMDIFILPSLFEGFPVTLIEAQAAGLPCLVSDAVDEEAKINPNFLFESLNSSEDKWSDDITKLISNGRYNSQNHLISRGFDIKYTSKILDSLYKRHMQ